MSEPETEVAKAGETTTQQGDDLTTQTPIASEAEEVATNDNPEETGGSKDDDECPVEVESRDLTNGECEKDAGSSTESNEKDTAEAVQSTDPPVTDLDEKKEDSEIEAMDSSFDASEIKGDLKDADHVTATKENSGERKETDDVDEEGDQENNQGVSSSEDMDTQQEGEGSAESGSTTTVTEDATTSLKKRNSLIDRVKTVTEDGETDEEYERKNGEEKVDDEEDDPWMIPESNLRNSHRRICVVTTAALPWRTGTAVNPLLRALYLTRGRPKHSVTLVIPWCGDENDRKKTLGKEHSFSNQGEQETWIRDFCRTRANCEGEQIMKM